MMCKQSREKSDGLGGIPTGGLVKIPALNAQSFPATEFGETTSVGRDPEGR
jgi:hypothetical protein